MKMTSIERAAVALRRINLPQDDFPEMTLDESRVLGRAALAAIAEPTPEMIEAGAEAMRDLEAEQCASDFEDFALAAWRAMHAAMLMEGKKT